MQKKHYILFALILLVYIANLFINIMAVDAVQYAEISWEMLKTKSFLQVHCLGGDYLDKPPMLFWLNSISFYFFGLTTLSYKVPSLIFALGAIYSTYRFARLYYPQQTAITAALMLASTQALFLITNDVRTDTVLMGAVMYSVWQWAEYLDTGKPANILLASFGLGLALLTKGPIALIVVAASFIPHMILTGKWKGILNWYSFSGIGIIVIMLLPMCIGLYEQYGMKGMRFYFWTQSFGRITGESEWNNHPDTFFLMHTTAWAFTPWALFLFWGWGSSLLTLVKNKFTGVGMTEVISVSGFTLVLIALMLSKYQLPHYIFVVYPLGAVMAAHCHHRLDPARTVTKVLIVAQAIILIGLMVLAGILQYCFKGSEPLSLACILVLFPLAVALAVWSNGPVKNLRAVMLYMTHTAKRLLNKGKGSHPKVQVAFDILYRYLFMVSMAVMISFNLLLSLFYFPAIMRYQPSDDFGKYVKQNANPDNTFVTYQYGVDCATTFYAQQMPAEIIWRGDVFSQFLGSKGKLLVLTTEDGLKDLRNIHTDIRIISERYSYKVANLSLDFINPDTRNGVCSKLYLLEAYSGKQ